MKFIEDAALILVIGGFILGLGIGYYATDRLESQNCNHSHATLSSHPLAEWIFIVAVRFRPKADIRGGYSAGPSSAQSFNRPPLARASNSMGQRQRRQSR